MRKVAFLVANDTFPEDPSIPSLRFTQNDASELAKALEDPETCGFETRLFLNETSQKVLADLEQISEELEADDTLLFYYAGHGKLRKDGQLCLASKDTTMAHLGARSIRAREVLAYLQESHARRRLLILDCCQSGAIGREFRGNDLQSSLAGLADSFGSYVLTASTAIQLAEEREKDGHGVFTKALIDCLRDGGKESINVNDWYEFAYKQLKALANQTPLKWGIQEEGPSFEIGNFRAKHERARKQLEQELRLEQERLERERQQERERLISTARARLGNYVALGELTEEQAEEAIALLKRDEARLFPRDRKYRDDLIRFSKGEASFLEVFGAGHILRPEPAPEPPEDEVGLTSTPTEAPVAEPSVSSPEPTSIEQPALLADQTVAPPEREAPLGLAESSGEGAKWNAPTRERKPISAAAVLFGVGFALAITLLGIFFYLDSRPIATSSAKPGSEFTDCEKDCPAMIVVPAGKFAMGSPTGEIGRDSDEGPRHEVTIARPFAVSKFEVTFAEWDACVAAAACPQAADRWGGQMPVVNVSWEDAKQYVRWLWLTGKDYRLLTEAEWEYAARAGTTTRYSWGDEVGKGNANCDGCGSRWDGKQTAPVGSFKPNAFGLYDMQGNVWEWVEDVWHGNYEGAPTDGSAWLQGGDPSRRVVRGGSWSGDPRNLRSASRVGYSSDFRFDYLGFRVARTLTP